MLCDAVPELQFLDSQKVYQDDFGELVVEDGLDGGFVVLLDDELSSLPGHASSQGSTNGVYDDNVTTPAYH